MTDWTFGALKAHNMALEAFCQNAECRRFFAFDVDALIASFGADYLVADIPPLECQVCGGDLAIKLALPGPDA